MSLDVGRYRLYSAAKVVQQHWDEARMHWSDVVRQEFAKEFFDPIEPCVQRTLTGIDRLAQVLNRLKQECGGDEL